MDLATGDVFAGYRIEREIGRGGMSVVYLAEDPGLGRRVALKVLAPRLADDPDFRDRFMRESRLAASLDHPNVIPIFAAGDDGGALFIAMRYVDGPDLYALVHRHGPLGSERVSAIVGQVARALDAAHARDLVHRDVKPHNILVDVAGGSEGTDQVYLSDFGVTRHLSSVGGRTQTGRFVGTLAYAAPEQIRGGPSDPRADQYSLACVTVECLIGRPPFPRDNDAAVMYAHLSEDPPSIGGRRFGLPGQIDEVLRIALAKDPGDRFETCTDFARRLRLALAARAGSARGPSSAGPEMVASHRTESAPTWQRGPASAREREAPTTDTSPWPTRDVGGRRHVTVVFADFVGFSSIAEHTDPEDLRSIVAESFAELRGVIEAREGRIEKFIGDAVMAVFGAPVAHEDDPLRAVDAAVEMLGVVGARSQRLGTSMRLRIGINSGLVVAGRPDGGAQTGVMGDPVNIAARLQQLAEPDQIVVSETVWRRVRHEYETAPMGRLEIAGREQAVGAHRVIRRRPSGGGRRTPFVGREDELALLDLLWSNASRGSTHVVTLVGEPGLGKSRLLSEFTPRPNALDIRIACESTGPFGLFVDLSGRLLGGLPTNLGELRARAQGFAVDEQTIQAMAVLLGLEADSTITILEEEKRRMYVGVWKMLLAVSRRRPVLVVIDDVHQADESSLDLLSFLLERLGEVPLMLLLAYRPGFTRLERVAIHPSRTAIHLELLSQAESAHLARGYLGVDALPPDVARVVATRAEGNAFFIQELLQALLELGSLTVAHGRARMTSGDLDVPDTVQGTIQARVDRLLPRERSLLQHAAVIGRAFSTDLIEATTDEGDLSEALERLERAELLVSRGPDEWSIKHALIREVVYEAMLMRQRREMHRRVAETLEANAGSDPSVLEALAEHYSRAEVVEKARRYAIAAGDAASERMGVAEARVRYESAVRHWGSGDERGRLQLLMKLAYAELMSADAEAARAALVEAEAGWRALGDLHNLGATTALLGRVCFFTGEMDRATDALYRGVELLEPRGPSQELVRAFVWTSVLNVVKGRAEEGMQIATRGLEMAEELHMRSARSHLLNSLGVFEVLSADTSGLDRIRVSLEIAEGSEDVEAVGRAYLNLTKCLGELYRLEEALDLCERGRAALRRLGAPTFEWLVAGIQAQVLVERGRTAEGEDLAREILGPRSPRLVVPAIVHGGLALGEALFRTGRYSEAGEVLEATMPSARQIGGSMFLAPTLLLEAKLAEAEGDLARARRVLTETLDVALGSSAVAHWFRPLIPAARIMPVDEVVPALRRVRPYAHRDPSFGARLAEAEATIGGDRERFVHAADLYAGLGLPFQEARCRVEADETATAARLISRYSYDEGPLGARVAARSSP